MRAHSCLCYRDLPNAAKGRGCAANSASQVPCSGFLCVTLHADGWCWDVTRPSAALPRQFPASNESFRLWRCQLGTVYRKPFPCSDPWGIAALFWRVGTKLEGTTKKWESLRLLSLMQVVIP